MPTAETANHLLASLSASLTPGDTRITQVPQTLRRPRLQTGRSELAAERQELS